MSDDLLPYYKNELSFIRRLGAEFAEEHPKLAERLRITSEGPSDPHVERLIEAFAFLTARIRRKLDDEFPEITQALLGVLYPHYLAPLPSMAIAQFRLDPGQAELTTGYSITRHSLLESEPTTEGPCRFRTCYPLTLWPIEVASGSLRPLPLVPSHLPKTTQALLRLELRCLSNDVTFGKMPIPFLRFYLKGQEQHAFALYELIFNNTVAVELARSPNDPHPMEISPDALRSVGFSEDESMLPYSARSFPGYRLLSEYFAFPRKYLFFDITGLNPALLKEFGRTLEIRLYHNRTTTDLEQNISADTFRLGCTPVVNLFTHRAEPIQLTQAESEYHVVPDSRQPMAHEVYTVESVTATSPEGDAIQCAPFYSIKHGMQPRGGPIFWQASRRPASRNDGQVDHGTEMYLTLVDLHASPEETADWTIDADILCLNRDLPSHLPSGGGQPGFQLSDGGPVTIECLSPPTATLRPPLEGGRDGLLWRLISHLSLNHLSLGDADGKPEALREILKLYDPANTADTQARIASILSVQHRRVVGRAGAVTAGGFCRGTEVSIQFDESQFSDNGVFLFATVLERFLGLYCSINSFSQLVATTRQRKGELRRWLPRTADRILL